MTAVGLKESSITRWCSILMGGSSVVVPVDEFLIALFSSVNGLPQGSALSCTPWVVLLQPAVAYLNQLRSVGCIAGFTLPSGRASPAVLVLQTIPS